MACLTGRFKTDTCFAEKLLRKENGGAVGIVAACRESYSGYTDALVHGMVDAIWPDPGFPMSSPMVPDPVVESHDPIYTMGDIVLYGYLKQKAWWSTIHDSFLLFHFHGDPTMPIWTKKPETLSAKFPNLIKPTAAQFTLESVNAADGYATLYSKGSNKIVGKTRVTGSEATIPVTAQLTLHDTLILTLTAHNYRPIIQDIPVSNDQTGAVPSVDIKNNYVNLFINGRRFTITGTSMVNLKIYSVNGRLIFNRQWKTVNNDIKVNAPKLSTGLYFVRIQCGKKEIVENMFYLRK